MLRIQLLFLAFLFVLGFSELVAWAQVTPPDPASDPIGWAQSLYAAFTQKEWSLLVAIVLMGVVWLLRLLVPKLRSQGAGYAVNFGIALFSSFAVAHVAGQPLIPAIIGGVTAALEAAMAWEIFKDAKAKLGKSPEA